MISDMRERFSWVRIVFCFRDSARAQAPEAPIWLSKRICTGQLNLVTHIQTVTTLISDIQERFSWVSVVFCFRDSARARAPSAPIWLPKRICTGQLNLVTD